MATRNTERDSINVPRSMQWPIMTLRVLCILPAFIGGYNHLTYSPSDESELFQNKSTPLLHKVALLWCSLAGYWCWILITSMLNRWLRYYEISSAMVRLITLTFAVWSVFAYLSSSFGMDQPVWKWMTICVVLFISNILKKTFAGSHPHKPSADDEPRTKSTFVQVLILPLTVVVFITMFASLYQVGKMRRASFVLAEQRMMVPAIGTVHPDLEPNKVRVMVFVLSSWGSGEKRKVFRETTLKLMNNDRVSYFYRFVLEQPTEWALVEKEMNEHKDILVLEKEDDMSKKLYGAFEWADQYDFDYFIKTDDDIFVRWDTISKELELAGRTQRYWRGLVFWNIPPIRNTEDGEVVYPLPIFPPYTAGALYILSRDIVHLIAGVPGGGPRMFVKNEDQNLGIWLFPFNILPIHDRRIQQIDVCENDMIGKHFGDFSELDAIGGTMEDMLNNLLHGRKMCHGFKTSVCAICYPCHGKQNHWRDWGFDCDDKKGVTLLNSPQLTIVE